MKKLLLAAAAAALICGTASAQVMQNSGVENTVFTGFGAPLEGDPVYFGIIDALQARIDISQFTLEGMINWGALAHCDSDGSLDNFAFVNTNKNALSYLYNAYGNEDSVYIRPSVVIALPSATAASGTKPAYFYNSYKNGQTVTDNYYVNFLWHPVKELDVGIGTKLNWQVGPSPRFGSWLWESDAHVRQGGFSTAYDDRTGNVSKYVFEPDVPGSADVVGFVPYANKYAKKAMGVRWFHETSDFTMQVGAAIPNETDTDNFRTNVGFQMAFTNFTISAAYEGLFQQAGNFYAGAGFGVKQFFIDAYFAWDHIDSWSGDENMSNSIGGAVTINFEKIGLSLRPETAFNWFENNNYTPSWYIGANAAWNFNEKFEFDCWSSFAIGSKNTDWDSSSYAYYNTTKDWSTGHIFDIRPEAKFFFSEHSTFSAFMDLQERCSFDDTSRWAWSTGAYWTYKLDMSGSSSKSSSTKSSSKSSSRKSSRKSTRKSSKKR